MQTESNGDKARKVRERAAALATVGQIAHVLRFSGDALTALAIEGQEVIVEVAGVNVLAAADLLDLVVKREGGEPCDVS